MSSEKRFEFTKDNIDLYDDWGSLPENSQSFIENVMADGRFEELYEQTASGEKEVGALLVRFEQNYPNVITGKNVNEIAGNLQKKTDRASILTMLREKKGPGHDSAGL